MIKKIAAIQSEIGKLQKTGHNPHFKSNYVDLNALLDELTPLLDAHGLILMQPIVADEVRSEIIDLENGETITSSIKIPNLTDPQKIGSCITYFRRYTLMSLLTLQSEDDDANIASGHTKPPAAKKDERAWLNIGTPQWKEAIKYLVEGGTIDKIKAKYKLSKDNEQQLISASQL